MQIKEIRALFPEYIVRAKENGYYTFFINSVLSVNDAFRISKEIKQKFNGKFHLRGIKPKKEICNAR